MFTHLLFAVSFDGSLSSVADFVIKIIPEEYKGLIVVVVVLLVFFFFVMKIFAMEIRRIHEKEIENVKEGYLSTINSLTETIDRQMNLIERAASEH